MVEAFPPRIERVEPHNCGERLCHPGLRPAADRHSLIEPGEQHRRFPVVDANSKLVGNSGRNGRLRAKSGEKRARSKIQMNH
jgi:hypothetical protein